MKSCARSSLVVVSLILLHGCGEKTGDAVGKSFPKTNPSAVPNPGNRKLANSQASSAAQTKKAPWSESLETFFAKAPSFESATHDLEWYGAVFEIDAPVDAKVSYDLSRSPLGLKLANGDEIRIAPGQYALDDILADARSVQWQAKSQVDVYDIGPLAVREWELAEGQKFNGRLNVEMGYFRFFVDVYRPSKENSWKRPGVMPLADCASLFKMASTLRLKSPPPEDRLKLLEYLGIEHKLSDSDPKQVESIRFHSDCMGNQIGILEMFPEVTSVEVGCLRNDRALPAQFTGANPSGGDPKALEPLLKCPKLRKLEFAIRNYVMKGNPSDEELAVVAQCEGLEYLNVNASELSLDGLKHLGKLSNLKTLHLINTSCTTLNQHGAPYLESMRQLSELTVTSNALTKTSSELALGHLAGLPLKTLTFQGPLDVDGFHHLSKLNHLESLDIKTPLLSDESCAAIASVPNLKSVRIDGKAMDVLNPSVTAKGLQLLKDLKLEKLDLENLPAAETFK